MPRKVLVGLIEADHDEYAIAYTIALRWPRWTANVWWRRLKRVRNGSS
jgi:hypothetical protein